MPTTSKDVRNHDFRRGDVIERVNLQAIQGLLETFARSATQKFTTLLHQPCVFEINKLDQLSWADLIKEVENGMYFFTFSLSPLAGRAVLAIPTDEALALVDLRLAGSGDDDFSDRIPSEIDQAFLAPIIEDFIGELGQALSRIQATVPILEAQEANILFVSIASPSEMCIVVRSTFFVANRPKKELLICLPLVMVRMLIEALQSKQAAVDENEGDIFAADAKLRILETPVDVVFQFPGIATTPGDLISLKVGDTLGLGHPTGRPLEVRAEGVLVALAEICSSGVHKACEIKKEVMK